MIRCTECVRVRPFTFCEPHVVQGGDGLQGHRHDGGDFEGLEAEPDVAVAPNGDVILLRRVYVPTKRVISIH